VEVSYVRRLNHSLRLGDDYPNIAALPFVKIVGAESFHPKPAAHAKIATEIYNKYSDTTNIITTNSGYPIQVPTPGSYWSAAEMNSGLQKAVPFLTKFTIKKKDMFEISFPVFTFKPGSEIVLELHSDIKNLGIVRASEDGSLATTISSEDFEPGFHSVHALGKDFAENDIDIYDFLEVEQEETVSAVSSASHKLSDIKSPTLSSQFLPSYQIPTSSRGKHDALIGILGSSIMNMPSKGVTSIAKGEIKPYQKHITPLSNRYKWLLIGVIIGLLLIIAGMLFRYNQQKNTP
jgi:hypothetical protein